MSNSAERFQQLVGSRSLFPQRDRLLCRIDAVTLTLGVIAVVVLHGLRSASGLVRIELGLFLILAGIWLAASLGLRYRWSLARRSFLRQNIAGVATSALWLLGTLGVLLFGQLLDRPGVGGVSRFTAFVGVAQAAVTLRAAAEIVVLVRRATAGATDPAVVLVGSFAILITVGTGLLMLPNARPADAEPATTGERFVTALFTSTSASCVTGLIVVPTEEYWSPFGQTIIMGLFQIGGLGIMTCGAFFAVAAGRHMQVRESATLRDFLESEQLGDVRRLVITILVFTFGAELIGAVLISGLWSDLSFGEQVRHSLFHSVSAFCNAGFALRGESFVGWGHRWQVWFGVAGLIIVGGMGFGVLYNIALWARAKIGTVKLQPLFNLPRDRVRLSLTTRLAFFTTVSLLVFGAVGYYVLESTAKPVPDSDVKIAERARDKIKANESLTDDENRALSLVEAERRKGDNKFYDAWFQSVTFRTAGFNSVDHGKMQPATKLFAILLMFIGASPGSTGGGVKTVCFAIAVLSLVSILRGRNRVEIAGRTIPPDVVNRSLAIISLGIVMVMMTTLCLVLFEKNAETQFLDYLFEATSAYGTVGVSAGVTSSLTTPSRIVIIVTMFAGRVGPLTLLIALSGRHRDARYEYPQERVTLG